MGDAGEGASQGRDVLVIALQRRGLTVRKAQAAVKAFWEILAQGLRSRYVETPLGIFDLVRRIPRKRQRWGREQALYTQSRIRFRPSRQLVAACNPQLKPKESPVSNAPGARQPISCPRCGSTEFTEGQFRQYRSIASSGVGGDLSPMTEQPMEVLVCLCGTPVRPLKLRVSSSKEDRASILRSFEAAWVATKQHDDLAARVAQLEAIVKELLQRRGG